MSIQSEITRITQAVTSQTDLIAQITAALEGKAGGGGSAFETGSFTPSANQNTVKVTHGLGVVPTFAVIYDTARSYNQTGNYQLFAAIANQSANRWCAYSDGISAISYNVSDFGITEDAGALNSQSVVCSATDSSITFGNSRTTSRMYFVAGRTYEWFLFGG